MGAEAIQELLHAIDLEKDSAELQAELADATGQKRARIIKRLEVVEAFRESGNKPEWMILTLSRLFRRICVRWYSWMADVLQHPT